MSYTLLFTEEANQELEEAFETLDALSQKAADRFIFQLDKVQQTILAFPLSYPLLITNYRKAVVKGFPYLIVYEVLEDLGIILIASVFYTRRNTDDLERRLT